MLDLDALSILPTPSNVHLVEGGAPSSFSVRLTHQPIADMTVTIANPDPGAYAVSLASIDFTTANWNVPVVVTDARRRRSIRAMRRPPSFSVRPE